MKHLIFVMLLATNLYAADTTWSTSAKILTPSCKDYLSTFSNSKEIDDWNKNIDARIEQKLQDNGNSLSKDSALQSIALDWSNDNEKRVERHEKAAIKIACMFLVRFWENGINPPSKIRERFNVDEAKELADWLKEDIQEYLNDSKIKNN